MSGEALPRAYSCSTAMAMPVPRPSCMNPPTRQDAALLSVVDAFVFPRAPIPPAAGRHAD